MCFLQQVSKWGDKIAGLVVVEPGISTASFKEWGEGKVRPLFKLLRFHCNKLLFTCLFRWHAVSYVHKYTNLFSANVEYSLVPLSRPMYLWNHFFVSVIFCS